MEPKDGDEYSSHASSAESDDEQRLNVAGGAGREEDWDEWQGDAGDVDEDETKSLFGPERLPHPEAAMEHDTVKYGFDLRQFAIQVGEMPLCVERIHSIDRIIKVVLTVVIELLPDCSTNALRCLDDALREIHQRWQLLSYTRSRGS